MIELKKHPGIAIIWCAVIGLVGTLVFDGKITWEIGVGFLFTLGLPSILGQKNENK